MQVSRKVSRTCPSLSVLLRASSTIVGSGSRNLGVRGGFRKVLVAVWEAGGGWERVVWSLLLMRVLVLSFLCMVEEEVVVVVGEMGVDLWKGRMAEALFGLL